MVKNHLPSIWMIFISPMKPNTERILRIFQLLVSFILMAIGCVIAYENILLTINKLDVSFWEISFTNQLRRYGFFILWALLGLVSGTIMFNTKSGWILSVSFWIINIIWTFFLSLIHIFVDTSEVDLLLVLGAVVLCIISISILISLTGIAHRNRYNVDRKSWLLIASIILLLIFERVFS